jgi:Domain of unknown function (DUF4287)/Domain of unknown function (DUF5655)
MASVADALKSQIRNIETTYGRSMGEWTALIEKSGLTKHSDVVAMLKRDHGVSHGAAHRISLVSRERAANRGAPAPGADIIATLLGAKRAHLRSIVDRLLEEVRRLGEFEVAPKKGYLSLRRRKQFGMIKPAASHVDLGLILVGQPAGGRLESAVGFNALFTHRVRVRSDKEVDRQLRGCLQQAFHNAR